MSATEEFCGNYEGIIMTVSGRLVKPLEPDPHDIDPLDIAHSLSNQCRYAGGTKHFYSVAEHCVLIYDQLARFTDSDKETLSWALLHDADEYVFLDLPAPVKHHPSGFGQAFIEATDRLTDAVAQRFGLSLPVPPIIKEWDLRIRVQEKYDLMHHHPVLNNHTKEELPGVRIHCWYPEQAKEEYIERLALLGIVKWDKRKACYVAS